MLITIQHNLCLSYNHYSLFPKRNNSQNKTYTSQGNNDYVSQSANTIYCKHNIHLSLQ
jgi:hypothetical protein